MSSQEHNSQVKYSEVSPFQISDGYSRSTRMEPVKTIRIFIAAVAANLSAFAVGNCLGWTSPVGPKLKAQDTTDSPLDTPITSENDAWISSILALGALAAPFIAGPLADRIGRKWVLLSSSIFFIVASVCMMVASQVWVLLLGRLIQGFGVGFVMTVQPMYVGEIATDAVRGATGSLMQLFIVAGILYVYAIGPYVSYMALQWCCLVIPIIFDVVFFFMPESPYYYAGKGHKSDALNSLQFLRGQSLDIVQDEMATIQGEVEESMANKGTFIDIVKNPGNRKALIISAGLVAFQQLSGINVVLFNSQSIFEGANTGLDPAIATIIVGCVQVGSSGLTPIIADRMGRKVILLISAFFMSVGLVALGSFFYVQAVGDASSLSWLPVPALVLYNIVYCIGFGPLPWAVLGEMFPANVKSIASSIVASTCWTLGFVVTRWYPALDALGSYYAFWLFAIFCVIAFFFVLFIVMETKGLSLQEIQDRLNGKKPN
ncbi:PREDICTED: facilitated trehalose transporter Tret1 isoform X1 [Rhagoletis zephyria]|uniref:facilitated trehalose transporter Tret1 isoform X1 n=2 Tax=Rhagoletis zephyria TaxID=28612 RepID=UPI00081166AD|nr:PREDICTED: facilitated trehalose transporter Tret1 isoform X1 [Rhagoletis zephyria]XP_017464773.1 PREDICTED: facilitated trehalose transporter Tret1 isoform X1 [Rhagoletis zephyria]